MTIGSTDYNRDYIMDFYQKHADGHPMPTCSLHGGVWEAALNYAMNPEYFQPQYIDETKYPQHYGALNEYHTANCRRPCKDELRKFTPEFAHEIREATMITIAP